ncbi:MAG: hypothetical protein ACK2UB_07035 [Anaerolineales bacterium]
MPSYLPQVLIAQCSDGTLIDEAPAGYAVHSAPRRAARGRSGETLFTALTLQSHTALPPAEQKRLSDLMARVFFETSGSVTAALRAAFVAANAEVLPFSRPPGLAASPGSAMVQLHAVCAVHRGGDIYLGYGGNVLALLIGRQTAESHPAPGDPPARPLGTSLNIDLRYGHSVLSTASTLILSADPPSEWTAAVPSGLANLSLQALGERMAHQCASREQPQGAFLVRFLPESAAERTAESPLEKLLPFRRKKSPAGTVSAPAGKKSALFFRKAGGQRAVAADNVEEKAGGSSSRSKAALSQPDPSTGSPPPPLVTEGSVRKRPLHRQPIYTGEEDSPAESPPRRAVESPSRMPSEKTGRLRHPKDTPPQPVRESSAGPSLSARAAVGAFGHSIRVTFDSAVEALRSFLAGILPRGVLQENERFILPAPVLLGTAIAIPLVIVAVVAVLYFRKGYEMEFARLMEEARTAASVANAQTDPLEARVVWQQTFDLLQTASQYGSSDELDTLQIHAARMLDTFDGITPLEFKPAVAGGFSEQTQITALLAGDRELYALDGIRQRIFRLLLGQGGYQLDETFLCQAGEYPDISVESLVDMVWVPDLAVGTQALSSTRSGTIVAIDPRGTALYCTPGGKTMAGVLPAPRSGWSSPAAIDYYNGRLYVLDPDRDGFWRYGLTDGSGFDQTPSEYFTADHPSLSDAIDFAVASGEVFFLHADGHVTRCQYDPLYLPEGAATAGGTLCESLPFNDTRPGRTSGMHIADALLNRIAYNEPPEPTLFFLDPLGRGAFRFSLALNFIARYRVTVASEKHEATALTIGADKVLYIAVGNQIYYAQTRTP